MKSRNLVGTFAAHQSDAEKNFLLILHRQQESIHTDMNQIYFIHNYPVGR